MERSEYEPGLGPEFKPNYPLVYIVKFRFRGIG